MSLRAFCAKVWQLLRRWWCGPTSAEEFHGVASIASTEDDETLLAARKLVVVGDPGRPKWLRCRCPCGCGVTIALNLMSTHWPRWTIESHTDGTLSVTPSVDSTACGSHFWIRRSRVVWANATSPT